MRREDKGRGGARHPGVVARSILDLVGGTPLLRLPPSFETEARGREIWLKLEAFQPGGSVKDRIALEMILRAEEEGLLAPGGTVVEATSGNTGVGLALVAAARGYRAVLVLPDRMSPEKATLLRAFGAEVVLTPAGAGPGHPDHYEERARRLAASIPGAWFAGQFENPANPAAHERTTAREIWEQMDGRLDAVVAGCGTGGTLHGLARALRPLRPGLRIVAADPEESVYATWWKERRLVRTGLRRVEGVGEDRIPATWVPELLDACHTIPDAEAFHWTRRLAREAGLFLGASSGLALAAALREAPALPRGARIVVLCPDSGDRYLSRCHNEDWLRDLGHFPLAGDGPLRVVGLLRADRPRGLLEEDANCAEALRQAGERGVRPLPLRARDGRLLGVADEGALLRLLADGADLEQIPARRCLAPAPPVLAPEAPWTEALEALLAHEAVLVAGDGGWTGLDRRDLLRRLPRLQNQDAADRSAPIPSPLPLPGAP